MKTHSKLLLSLLVTGGILTGGLACRTDAAEQTPPTGFFADRLALLGITADQKTAVKDILRKHQPAVGPLIRQVVDERRALRETIRAPEINETAIRAQAAKVGALEAELAVQRAYVAHELRAVLTPDQLGKLQNMQVDVDARIDGALERIAKRIAAE